MDRDTYLILRVTGIENGASDPFSTPDRRSDTSPGSTREIEYRVDEQHLDSQDYGEVRRDRQVAAIARPMPLQLIQPVAAQGPAAEPKPIHDATWGVFVTGALQSPYVGHGVTVAILDTGIDAGHEAFRGVELIQKDFTGEGDGDQQGHGTHVAGTIFGQTVQGVRYARRAGVRRALIGKVLGKRTRPRPRNSSTRSSGPWTGAPTSSTCRWASTSPAWSAGGRGLEADLATSRALAEYRDNVRLFDAGRSAACPRGAFPAP